MSLTEICPMFILEPQPVHVAIYFYIVKTMQCHVFPSDLVLHGLFSLLHWFNIVFQQNEYSLR